jgi:hypothetical protein
MANSRNPDPGRRRRLPAHTSIEKAERLIAKRAGLPLASIRLVQPGGRKARRDTTVGALREKHGWA